MSTNDMSSVVQTFESELLHTDSNLIYSNARVEIPLSSSYHADAIASLFELCKPSEKYIFVSEHDEKDRDKGYIRICTMKTEAGARVDTEFMKLFKNKIPDFLLALAESWIPYPTDKTGARKMLFGLIGHSEAIYYKQIAVTNKPLLSI